MFFHDNVVLILRWSLSKVLIYWCQTVWDTVFCSSKNQIKTSEYTANFKQQILCRTFKFVIPTKLFANSNSDTYRYLEKAQLYCEPGDYKPSHVTVLRIDPGLDCRERSVCWSLAILTVYFSSSTQFLQSISQRQMTKTSTVYLSQILLFHLIRYSQLFTKFGCKLGLHHKTSYLHICLREFHNLVYSPL